MSRRSVIAMAGLIIVGSCTAMAVLPARWALAILPGAWPLAVVNASGTLWSGSATLAVGTSQHRRTIPDPLRWRFSFSGSPRLLVSHAWLDGTLTLAPRWLGVGVSAQSLQLPAAVLSTLDARIAAIGPSGELSIRWPATFIGLDDRPAGSVLLDIQWSNAASALTPIHPLGHYALALKQGRPDAAELNLSSKQGPLLLNGAGTLDRNNGFRFDGTAHADPAASADVQAALRNLLTALGPRKNNQTLLQFR